MSNAERRQKNLRSKGNTEKTFYWSEIETIKPVTQIPPFLSPSPLVQWISVRQIVELLNRIRYEQGGQMENIFIRVYQISESKSKKTKQSKAKLLHWKFIIFPRWLWCEGILCLDQQTQKAKRLRVETLRSLITDSFPAKKNLPHLSISWYFRSFASDIYVISVFVKWWKKPKIPFCEYFPFNKSSLQGNKPLKIFEVQLFRNVWLISPSTRIENPLNMYHNPK